jgi:hypothetical protein
MIYPTWTAEQIKDELGIPYHDLRVLLKYTLKRQERYNRYNKITQEEYNRIKELIK